MARLLDDSVSASHRLHLRALVRQERRVDYQRQDYLSPDFQKNLLRRRNEEEEREALENEGAAASSAQTNDKSMKTQQRESPASITSSSSSVDFDTTVVSSLELCIRWRTRIVEWKYQVVDRFDLSREIVSISSFYLDQYLSMYYVADAEIPLPQLFQLVAITSIYLAIKIHSTKKVPIHAILCFGSGLITVGHIEEMELSIMKSLRWCLSPPTAVAFIENMFPLILNTDIVCGGCHGDSFADARAVQSLDFAIFLAELSVCAYPFVPIRPSSTAIAAVLYSMEILGHTEGSKGKILTLLRDKTLALVVDASEVKVAAKFLREMYLLSRRDNETDANCDGQRLAWSIDAPFTRRPDLT